MVGGCFCYRYVFMGILIVKLMGRNTVTFLFLVSGGFCKSFVRYMLFFFFYR